ncbi:SIS domain-containing protein [Actinocorallia libanotica]|uniref:Bifunctional glucose-6-phosphate/mannose-6-phosphate isomerase C-terminal domain-containing protein n=1 Tax=Actinocorallia libanotica TaxID=46162 RepID=A0ABN1RHR1_9ACTN
MIPAGSLEDAAALEAGDPGGMLRLVASGAAHLRQAARLAEEAGLAEALRGAGRPRSVVVAGPGEAGEIVAAVCGLGCPVPVLSLTGRRLPGWVGAADLVFALGDAAFDLAEQGVRRGASVVGVGPADARLAQLAVQNRALYLPMPPGGPVRAMVWAQVVPMLLVLRGLRLVSLPDEVLESTALLMEDLIHRCRPAAEPFLHPGKQPALELAGSLPMPWGQTPVELAAASRLAAQLGDNAKVPGARAQIGALDGRPAEADPDDFFRDRAEEEESRLHPVVLLEEGGVSPVAEVARARGLPVTEIRAEGEHALERIASLIVICDYVSVYLALALGVDPTPVPARAELTARIS